jgi:hypothetical protein
VINSTLMVKNLGGPGFVLGSATPDYNSRKKDSFDIIISEAGTLKWETEILG